MNLKDINLILDGWEFNPREISVRKIYGDDGSVKLQLRLDLGLLQMEPNGRPDGTRPFGYESLLEYYKTRLNEYVREHDTDEGFILDSNDCAALQREAMQYYHRYLSYFQLKDYVNVQRDTRRNLEVMDLVKRYASNRNDINLFEQYRPYIIMMFTRATANIQLTEKNYNQALTEIGQGIQKIEEFFFEYEQAQQLEYSPELKFLRVWLREVEAERPLSLPEQLEKEMEWAIAREEYEQAAIIRDKLNDLLGK
ncbi:UvrB/UvrC motif-containing protein [candidate division KSB1 bacterium]|nr:UvrB/UvrC motif-containing protein [candidate division KSB1 bacterium]